MEDMTIDIWKKEYNWRYYGGQISLVRTANYGGYARGPQWVGLEGRAGTRLANVCPRHYYRFYEAEKCSGDLVHATISSAHPRLDAPDISKNPLTAIMPLGILTNTLDVNDIDSFKAEIVILIELYAHLSNIQSRILTQNPSNQDQLIPSFTQLSIALDHRLLRLGKPPSLQTGLHTAAHTVLIICAFLIFRNFSPRSQTMKALQARLIPTLTILYITTGALDRQELNMSLWILWIGALGALEQEWYAPRIQRVISALGMSKWTDLKIVLECFVWNAKLEDTACWRLCDLVGISKG